MNSQKKTMVILGMHRSGTSLIASWLHNCGLQIGQELLGPGLGNTEGHFEDIDFYNLHVEILRDNNLHDSGIIEYTSANISSVYQQKIKNLIGKKNQQFDQWGWKEPRTCLFLDFYRQILPEAYYLIVFRDYQFVVNSLLKRSFANLDTVYKTEKNLLSRIFWQKIKRKKAFKKFCYKNAESFLKVWICYNQAIINNIQNANPGKYLVVNYVMLKENDNLVFSSLTTNWGFALVYSGFSSVYNEKLASKPFNIDVFIENKQLITEAKRITDILMQYTLD